VTERRDARPVKRAILAVVSGGAVIGGMLLPWISSDGFTIGTYEAPKAVAGSEIELAPVVLGAGAAIVGIGLLALIVPRLRRIWAGLLLPAGGVVVVIAVLTLRDVVDQYVDLSIAAAGVPPDEQQAVRTSLQALIDAGVGIRGAIGLFVTLAGAVLAVLAGILILMLPASRRQGVAGPDGVDTRTRRPEPAPTSHRPLPGHDPTDAAAHVRLQRQIREHPSEPGSTGRPSEKHDDGNAAEEEVTNGEQPKRYRSVLGDTWSG
jgi:hypothetical protein